MRIDNPRITGSALISSSLANEHSFMGANVGIGTTNPEGNLHIHPNSAGSVTAPSEGDNLIIEDSATPGMSFLFPNNSKGSIYFGTPADNDQMSIIGDTNNNRFDFAARNASDVIRFRPAGGVLNLTLKGAAGSEMAQFEGDVSGSSTSTGSFGSVAAGGTGLNTFAGSVSIGNTGIHEKLRVEGEIRAHADVGDVRISIDSATNSDAQLKFLNGGGNSHVIFSDGSATNDPLIFYDYASSTAMMALNNGKVGIGVSSPEAIGLHIQLASSDTAIDLDDKGHHHLVLQNNNTATSNGRHVGINMQVNAGGGQAAADSSIYTEYEEDGGAKLHFTTTKLGTGQERMVIDSDGLVGIGTTSPSRALHVVGDALVTGILTAQEFHTEFVSASVMFDSGSTKFGDDTADIHQMTGSLKVSGSLGINLPLSQSGAEASLDVGTLVEGGDGVNFGVVIRGQELPGTNLELADGIGLKFEIPIDMATSNIGASIEAVKSSNLDSNSETKMVFKTSGNDETLDTALTIASNQNVFIEAAKSLYFDGGGHTYISETSNDVLDVYVGGANALKISSTEIQVPRYITHMGDGNNYLDFGTDTLTVVNDGGDTLQMLSNHDVRVRQGNLEVVEGNISGSYTSTASFGELHLVDDAHISGRIGINTDPDAQITTKTTQDGSNVQVALDHDGNTLMRLRDSSAAALFNLYDGGVEKITLDADLNGGSIVLEGNVSGSATSTGSFGTLTVNNIAGGTPILSAVQTAQHGAVGIGTATPYSAYYPVLNLYGAQPMILLQDSGAATTDFLSIVHDANNTNIWGYMDSTAEINLGRATNVGGTGYKSMLTISMVSGSVSGSSNSTGSFGQTNVGGRVLFTQTSNLSTAGSINLNTNGYLYISGGSGGLVIGDDALATAIQFNDASSMAFDIGGGTRARFDANSRISLSNNDTSGTGGGDSTSGNTILGYLAGNTLVGSSNTGYQSVIIGHRAGESVTTGDNNLIIGNQAGKVITTSGANVFLGTHAGGSVAAGQTTTDGTIAIGYFAANALTSGAHNTAIGYYALAVHTTGNSNTAIGYGAMDDTDAGSTSLGSGDNVFIGEHAGGGTWANAASNGNVGIGNNVMDAAMNGALNNTAVGHAALGALTTADFNTALGYQAGNDLTIGLRNLFLGYGAGANLTEATHNVAVGMVALGDVTAHVVGTVALGYNALPNSGLTTAANHTIAIGFSALTSLQNGARNVAIGYQSGNFIVGGGDNTLIGYRAGTQGDTYGMTTAERNVAVGSHAFGGSAGANITGKNNTAIGCEAMLQAEGAVSDNTAVGHNSLQDITTGQANTAVGTDALTNLTTGRGNIGIGSGSMGGAVVTGNDNIAVGSHETLDALTSGTYNVAIGYKAGKAINTGISNQLIGLQTGLALTTASSSIAIGSSAMAASTTGNQNIAIGSAAMNGGNTTGDNNIAIGTTSGDALTSAFDNVLIGRNAGIDINTGQLNTCIGLNAGRTLTSGTQNLLLGHYAGNSLNGTGNTFIGPWTGYSSADVDYAVMIGFNANGTGNMTSAADGTVAVGNEALNNLTSGAGNVAVGQKSLKHTNTGLYNTALGFEALTTNVDGDKNTAVGYQALKTFEPSSDGYGWNTALGWTAGDAVTTGYSNTFIGAEAGSTGTNDITTGIQNTLIGQAASVSANNATNQTVIGRGATGVANNTVVLGNTSVTDVYMASDGEATLHTGEINSFFSASALDPKVVFGSGSLGTSGSRYPTTDGIKMSPVHFTGYQEVQTGTGIIVAEVPYVSGIADSRLTGTLEVNYTAQEDSNRCGYYLFRIHYTGNTNITTVTNSTTNSSMAAVKVVAGDSMAIKITPTTTGTQNVLVYYEFKGFLGTS